MLLFNFFKIQLQVKSVFIGLIAAFFLLLPNYSGASTQEYNVKAVFLFHFIDFTSWPGERNKQEIRNICIYGKDPFDSRLQLLADSGLQQIPVKILPEINLASSSECHILFVSSSKKKQLNQIINYLANKPILTVSDIDDFAIRKGMIGFTIRAGKVKLEVNLDSVKLSGIKLSSNLIEIAKVVKKPLNLGTER